MYPQLPQLLTYRNDRLFTRYDKDFPNAKMQAPEALNELLKFMWISLKHKAERSTNPENHLLHFSCGIHPEMEDIDNMWHTFLLFTREYQTFCHEYLHGIFFHHEPSDLMNETSAQRYEEELTLYLSYIYDNLGKETVIKWFGA